MRCDACGGENPVVHLTEVVEDEPKTLHLCAACAEERGVDSPATPDNLLLAGVLAQMELASKGKSGGLVGGAGSTPPPCGFCGLTFATFRETGRLGCPHCWTSFERQLRPLLQRVQGATQHVGKVYLPPDPSASEREKRLEGLRKKLDRAVALEDFERAAELRDAIRELRGEAAGA